MTTNPVLYNDLHRLWPEASLNERMSRFQSLPLADAQEFFRELSTRNQYELTVNLPDREQTVWLRLLDPDDAADLIQESSSENQEHMLDLLDEPTRLEVRALLKYREDVAGGLMSPRFARVRPEMTVSEALTYVRKQATGRATETVYTVYVLDYEQHLLGVTSLRALFAADGQEQIEEIMRKNVVTAPEDADQEQLSKLFAEHDLIAIPVVDAENHMKGIVTIDDIVDVVQEEATEDIQKMGGSEALGLPYLDISFGLMVRKRAVWLTVLFLGEMLTANAMAYYENQIAKAVVLMLFVPLIISSGGNAGSQASTIVIRAMALGELRLTDWWRVMRREVFTGLTLGCILGVIGFARIVIGESLFHAYGPHSLLLGLTVGLALVGIVFWGSLAGSLLPFVLRRIGFDPASASTPFVATLVDVTGLIIYFSVASLVLRGTLL